MLIVYYCEIKKKNKKIKIVIQTQNIMRYLCIQRNYLIILYE